jgi:hypothetical protein
MEKRYETGEGLDPFLQRIIYREKSIFLLLFFCEKKVKRKSKEKKQREKAKRISNENK